MSRTSGFFITFEGPEGAGKSTQIKLLAEYLQSKNHQCVLTREPGGTPLAEKMRILLKHHNSEEKIRPMTEWLLICAARVQHVEEFIRPALKHGAIVLCDRFYDSTTAYQGAGRGLDEELMQELRLAVVGDCTPDLTLMLDLPPEVGFARTQKRAETVDDYDRFEQEKLSFHTTVRERFLKIAENEPERVKVVNADQSPEKVQEEIRSIVDVALRKSCQ